MKLIPVWRMLLYSVVVALTVANGSGAVFQGVTNTVVGGGSTNVVTGSLLVPPVLQSFTYDYDGNLASDGLFNYTWDAENRLKTVVPAGFSSGLGWDKLVFGYDHLGRRIAKVRSSGPTTNLNLRFVYDLGGWNLLAEVNAADNGVLTKCAGVPDV